MVVTVVRIVGQADYNAEYHKLQTTRYHFHPYCFMKPIEYDAWRHSQASTSSHFHFHL